MIDVHVQLERLRRADEDGFPYVRSENGRLLLPRLHDTTGCQIGLTTGLIDVIDGITWSACTWLLCQTSTCAASAVDCSRFCIA